MKKSEEIRNILKIERRKRNMNYKEFGALLGCIGRSVSYWEAGTRNISLNAADEALKKLGITLEIGRNKE
jgi:DNA-binding helix-turn-helix protein|nr:MAG TPA: helix-turn-helix domain protein [Caudoviricetes sp.]